MDEQGEEVLPGEMKEYAVEIHFKAAAGDALLALNILVSHLAYQTSAEVQVVNFFDKETP